MIGLATVLGVSQFVFVQWVAPFLSELPEFLTTTYWARSRGKAGMALMNMASSNINQWTVLAAMIPIVYSLVAAARRRRCRSASTASSCCSRCCRARSAW